MSSSSFFVYFSFVCVFFSVFSCASFVFSCSSSVSFFEFFLPNLCLLSVFLLVFFSLFCFFVPSAFAFVSFIFLTLLLFFVPVLRFYQSLYFLLCFSSFLCVYFSLIFLFIFSSLSLCISLSPPLLPIIPFLFTFLFLSFSFHPPFSFSFIAPLPSFPFLSPPFPSFLPRDFLSHIRRKRRII